MPYKFLEHTADALYEVEAKSIEELFIDAAKALTEIQVNISKVEKKQKYKISLENKDLEMLLFDWLSELVFVKDAKQLIFSDFDVEIKRENSSYKLRAVCYGEKIKTKHEQKADAKAITLHEFKMWQQDGLWKARVLVDV